MSERDYLTDAQNENASLRARIVELEEELYFVREQLRVARERKIEEVSASPDFHQAGVNGNRYTFTALNGVSRLTRVSPRKKPPTRTVPRKKKQQAPA